MLVEVAEQQGRPSFTRLGSRPLTLGSYWNSWGRTLPPAHFPSHELRGCSDRQHHPSLLNRSVFWTVLQYWAGLWYPPVKGRIFKLQCIVLPTPEGCYRKNPQNVIFWEGLSLSGGFYALSASKAIFRARTYNCITYSVR